MSNSKRFEKEIRCCGERADEHGNKVVCGKFLTKVIMEVDIPDWVLTKAKELGMIIPETNDGLFFLSAIGIEVKIGTETKCTRCKEYDYKILVA